MMGGHKQYNILVVGAGVVGLSTAVNSQKTWPDASVTVMADKFDAATTSYGAGGIFRPTYSKLPGVPEHLLRLWLSDSWKHYDGLAHSVDASLSGTQMISGYQFFNNLKENPLEKDFVYNYRPLTEREMKMFPGTENVSHGYFVTTLMTEGAIYLKYLMKRFEDMGGKYVKCKIHSLKELVGKYDVVFNCTGLGSQELLGDNKLVPIRGQLIKVRAPWIKHSLLFGDEQLTFIYPGQKHCVIGCTRQEGDYNLMVEASDRDRMWRDACKLMPSLKKAEFVSDWVGLRPHRNPLRVEKEVLSFGDQVLKVVHNYGHGAEGISLSWGTALYAVRLAQELLTDTSANVSSHVRSKL